MARGLIEEYEDDQLAVAISDLRAVGDALAQRGVRVGHEEQDPRLGLALLTLDGVEAAVAPLRANATGSSDLDLLICWLREHFQSAYDGWVPTIGKNRVIEPVRGLPYIGGGGEGDPYFGGSGDPSTSSSANGGTIPETAQPGGPPPEWPSQRDAQPGEGVRVGVLDTRLYPHAWLAGGYEATGNALLRLPAAGDRPLPASAGHATFIAGLILRQAPAAGLVIRPVLDNKAVGRAWDVAKKMVSFLQTGADILNLSFGCYTDDGQPPLVLARAVSLLSARILLVAAAGNHGDIDELRKSGQLPPDSWTEGLTPVTPVWPAAFDEVTAVGASNGDGLAAFTPRTPWVNLIAPGVAVQSTYLTGQVKPTSPPAGSPMTFNGFAYWDGTSFSAATVSGAVAARMRPGGGGGCGRQALASAVESSAAGIRPFTAPAL